MTKYTLLLALVACATPTGGGGTGSPTTSPVTGTDTAVIATDANGPLNYDTEPCAGQGADCVDVWNRAPEWAWPELDTTFTGDGGVIPAHDLTGDGVEDLMYAGYVVAGPDLARPLSLPDGAAAISELTLLAGDVDGDGIGDLRRYRDRRFELVLGPFSGAIDAQAAVWSSPDTEFTQLDLTHDGLPDLARLTPDGLAIEVVAGPPSRWSTASPEFTLRWTSILSTASAGCLEMIGDGVLRSAHSSVWPAADLDGDQVADSALMPYGQYFYEEYACAPQGGVVPAGLSGVVDETALTPYPYGVTLVPDQTGDGIADYVTNDALYAGPMTWDGSTWVKGAQLYAWPWEQDRYAIPDVDGDGVADWLVETTRADIQDLTIERGGVTPGIVLNGRWAIRSLQQYQVQGTTLLIGNPFGVSVFPLR